MAGVKFVGNGNGVTKEGATGDVSHQEDRKKFLTMKYGQSQIKLIQKRLKVEFWMDEELNQLYDVDKAALESYPCDIDLDEMLELESKDERRQFLLDSLIECKKPQDHITKFIDELLTKLDSL